MRGTSSSTKELTAFCYRLLKELHPMTLRQLHYAIFSRQEIEYTNTPKDYKRLSRVTTKARRAYRDWELNGDPDDLPLVSQVMPGQWIVDETREAEVPNVWTNVQDYIGTVERSYRRDAWQDQQRHCEVWSEKGTVLSSIRPVADEWGITLRTIHGFSSTGMESDTGLQFEQITKPITVYYLGDFDPSGVCIEDDVHRRVMTCSGRHFDMRRLAIHPNDIWQFDLPPQMVKETDTRARSFRERYGNEAATIELDALPVDELRRRIEVAVQGLLDLKLWEHQKRIQQVEFDSIAKIVNTIKNLPQAEGRA